MQYTRDYQPDPERVQALKTAMIITLVGNLILAVGKGIASYISGSIALYADAANSVSDVIYSIEIMRIFTFRSTHFSFIKVGSYPIIFQSHLINPICFN